jgi:hypothetical protein
MKNTNSVVFVSNNVASLGITSIALVSAASMTNMTNTTQGSDTYHSTINLLYDDNRIDEGSFVREGK